MNIIIFLYNFIVNMQDFNILKHIVDAIWSAWTSSPMSSHLKCKRCIIRKYLSHSSSSTFWTIELRNPNNSSLFFKIAEVEVISRKRSHFLRKLNSKGCIIGKWLIVCFEYVIFLEKMSSKKGLANIAWQYCTKIDSASKK